MKLMKGIMIGTLISAGVAMMYTDSTNIKTPKIMKKGKHMARTTGIM